jgi:hypothetical protein
MGEPSPIKTKFKVTGTVVEPIGPKTTTEAEAAIIEKTRDKIKEIQTKLNDGDGILVSYDEKPRSKVPGGGVSSKVDRLFEVIADLHKLQAIIKEKNKKILDRASYETIDVDIEEKKAVADEQKIEEIKEELKEEFGYVIEGRDSFADRELPLIIKRFHDQLLSKGKKVKSEDSGEGGGIVKGGIFDAKFKLDQE